MEIYLTNLLKYEKLNIFFDSIWKIEIVLF